MSESRAVVHDSMERESRAVRSGPGPGWVAFAGTILLLVGAFNMVVGFVALVRDDVFVSSPSGLLLLSLSGWGWVHLVAGVLLLATGTGVLSGNAVARTAAVVLAGVNALAQLTFLPAFPLWALIVITLDVVVIAALLTQGTVPVGARE